MHVKPGYLLITCEHGGNDIPPDYAELFAAHQDLLASHRGYDPGALELAKLLAKKLRVPLFHSTISRLLVELNRSQHHPALFSKITKQLSMEQKNIILQKYYLPYRNQVEQHIAHEIACGKMLLHISVHTFTPVLNGQQRNAEIGLLYDPARHTERMFASDWQQVLRAAQKNLRVRRNYPYLGKSDGFTTYLRKKFAASQYLGIEIEVNQNFPLTDQKGWKQVQDTIIRSLREWFY